MIQGETPTHYLHHWWCPEGNESIQRDDEKEGCQVDSCQQEGHKHFNQVEEEVNPRIMQQ